MAKPKGDCGLAYEIKVRFEKGRNQWIPLFGHERTLEAAKSRVANYLNDIRRNSRAIELPDWKIIQIKSVESREVVSRSD